MSGSAVSAGSAGSPVKESGTKLQGSFLSSRGKDVKKYYQDRDQPVETVGSTGLTKHSCHDRRIEELNDIGDPRFRISGFEMNIIHKGKCIYLQLIS